MKHLWEINHPYYMCEGNYFDGDSHREFKRWGNFIEEWGGEVDLDYNYVTRWDWLEGEDHGAEAFDGDPNYRNGRLMIQTIGQRKAVLFSMEIQVCRNDEPAVIEWLKPRFEYAMALWEPFDK